MGRPRIHAAPFNGGNHQMMTGRQLGAVGAVAVVALFDVTQITGDDTSGVAFAPAADQSAASEPEQQGRTKGEH